MAKNTPQRKEDLREKWAHIWLPLLLGIIVTLLGVNFSRLSTDVGDIKIAIAEIKGTTSFFATRFEAAELTSNDERVTIKIEPETITKDTYFQYGPMLDPMPPTPLPEDIQSTGYGFSITPVSPSGVHLSELPLEEGKQIELYITPTKDDLAYVGGEISDLSILYWDTWTGEWEVMKTEVSGHRLKVETDEVGLFLMAAMTD